MQNSHEPILAALFTLVKNAVVVNFTGTNTAISTSITGLSTVTGMFPGLPVFGPGVPKLTYIDTIDPVAKSIVVTQNIAQANAGAQFTTGFQYASRRLKLWAEQTEQPAMFLRHTEDEDIYNQTILQKTVINAEIWIYSQAGKDPNVAPDTTLNNLCTAVRSALASDNRGFPQTLGGLATWARVEGRSNYDPGDLDNQGKALIPVRILCP